jgi:hypothetical protein
MKSTKRQALAVVAYAWVLWAQTRTSGPRQPITDAWEIVETFGTREDCERARLTLEPPTVKPGAAWPLGTRYVCFPDTLDPQATP